MRTAFKDKVTEEAGPSEGPGPRTQQGQRARHTSKLRNPQPSRPPKSPPLLPPTARSPLTLSPAECWGLSPGAGPKCWGHRAQSVELGVGDHIENRGFNQRVDTACRSPDSQSQFQLQCGQPGCASRQEAASWCADQAPWRAKENDTRLRHLHRDRLHWKECPTNAHVPSW